jgi:hypothetical protein
MEAETPNADTSTEAAAEKKERLRLLEGDVAGMTATVDQLRAAQRNSDAMVMVVAFAFGVLAAIVALEHRKLVEIADALPS